MPSIGARGKTLIPMYNLLKNVCRLKINIKNKKKPNFNFIKKKLPFFILNDQAIQLDTTLSVLLRMI